MEESLVRYKDQVPAVRLEMGAVGGREMAQLQGAR